MYVLYQGQEKGAPQEVSVNSSARHVGRIMNDVNVVSTLILLAQIDAYQAPIVSCAV